MPNWYSCQPCASVRIRVLFASLLIASAVQGYGCAVSLGTSNGDILIFGMAHVSRAKNGPTTIVNQDVLGLHLRGGTVEDGITVGYSGMTSVFPGEADYSKSREGFCWPLAVAWRDSKTGAYHELGFVSTRVPKTESVSLVHQKHLGAACLLAPRRPAAVVGFRERIRIEAPPDEDGLYVVNYDSSNPYAAIFTAQQGEIE